MIDNNVLNTVFILCFEMALALLLMSSKVEKNIIL